MKLKEIKSLIFEDVCLYQTIDSGNYKDLWKGKAQDIPEELLDYSVGIIGSKRKGILDIELRR